LAKPIKLHELVAIRDSQKDQVAKIRADLANTFTKRFLHFTKKISKFVSNKEDGAETVEHQSELQTTVATELKWITRLWAPYLDTELRIALANQQASASVILEGADGTDKPIFASLPVVTLMELEKRLNEIFELASAIPTLDPVKGFTPAPTEGQGVFAARVITKTRTEKIQEALVLYPATDKHPAQTQLISKDVPIGTVTEHEWSGMITVTHKGQILERIENLRVAVKKARSRACEITAPDAEIGKTLFDYVFAPETKE